MGRIRLRVRHGCERVLVLSVAWLAAIAALANAAPSSAQTAQLPCPGMMNLVEGKIDPTLHLTARAEVTSRSAPADAGAARASDEVTLSWSLSAGQVKCIWIQKRGPGVAYSALADFVLTPDQTSRIDRPGALAGDYCYRVFAISDAGRSEPVESCVNITSPRVPAGPSDSPPLAPAAGEGERVDGSRDFGLMWVGISAIVGGMAALWLPALRRVRGN